MKPDAKTKNGVNRLRNGNRQGDRLPVSLSAVITTSSFEVRDIIVTELGDQGCRFHSDIDLLPGARITLALPEVGSVKGCVAWRRDDDFGIDFLNVSSKQTVA